MNSLIVETILREVEGDVRFNVAADARMFDCKFIEPGLISYRDHDKGGIELLRRETIERAMPSCIGNPVIVKHKIITSDNRMAHEQGIVTDWYFDATDGWFHVKGYIDGADAKGRIRRGEKPSCGYIVKSFGPSGKYHDIRYEKEITGLAFNHLAVVEKPRFEDATFRLNSVHVSLTKNMNVIKFLKKLVTRENGADGKPGATTVEAHEVPCTTQIEIDGKMVPLSEIAEGYRKNAAAPAGGPTEALTVAADDEVVVDGKNVTVSDLIAGYRKNGITPPAETAEQKAKREKDEADALAKKNEGNKSFITLHNARANTASVESPEKRATNSGTINDRILEGQKRYGSVIVVTGKN